MTDKKYNGWTNYPTWRVNLEVFGDLEVTERCTAEWCRDYMRELLELDAKEGLVLDYALAFIDTVNWYEIAEGINEAYADCLSDLDENGDLIDYSNPTQKIRNTDQ
jgi:hypothetical protein